LDCDWRWTLQTYCTSIFSVFAGGLLFGVVGVIISIPVTVIIMTTAKYYGEDIENGLNELINNAK
jgi:predicted PurR-regulated permease PerM